ncbi:hypothetical protein DIS24_g999 [Lasiodiplodia hormozganensis]|uniref:Uncharacterized protein n=1 Tax=Lasiodiplodia hormozganensis TaxID=869390 RepID=A0AA39Z4H1_9PEZI|nr:hypothetical protein DIS24_g999 [Lasiodiplodia hormozganensis]
MASTSNDGGKMMALSATENAIVASSSTETSHLPTEQAREIPSRRPGKIFDFMALTGELRNAIYQAVIDTMATTPDNPISLIPEDDCIRRYDCWLKNGNDWYRKINGYWSDDDEFDRIPVEELAEIGRVTKLRMNLATCRLGEVSRQIRSEFVPMLLGSLHFRLCQCVYGNPGHQPTIQAPIHQLAGMIHHLDYYTHTGWTHNPISELSGLLDTLLSLRFNGELKIVGYHNQTSLVRDCFDAFCASVREGGSRIEAQDKAFEVILRRFQLFGYGLNDPLNIGRQNMAFRFNFNDFLGKQVQTKMIGPISYRTFLATRFP